MTITYHVGNKLYLNITNQCCCNCTFCIRLDHDGVGDGENLWLSHEPTAQEVLDAIRKEDLSRFEEVVFCGYGEPTQALDVLLEVCRYLKSVAPQLPIRLNTNGQGDLINGKETAPLYQGLVDTISISLNAPEAGRYQEITRSIYGVESFEAMLKFARSCKEYVPHVCFTVVDVIGPEEIEESQRLADRQGIPLRVRTKE